RDRLKVDEYFLFDPYGDYLSPRLQGFRLVGDEYQPMQPRADGSLVSEVLGLVLEVRGDMLRFRDPGTGELLPTPEEARLQAQTRQRALEEVRWLTETERSAEREARLRAEAEREVERLARQRAELEA